VNEDGGGNFALGELALSANVSDGSNIAIGAGALTSKTTGNSNIAIGLHAAAYYGDIGNLDPVTSVSSSVYIGRYTAASANGVINEIAIGSLAIGNGSNTVTLGDDNVTDIYMAEDAGAIVHAGQYRLSALNTAPSSATDTGTLGEIRITADYIFVCTATDTWVRAALTTW